MSAYYLIVAIALIGVLWLAITLPQRRIRRQHEELVASLVPGQTVMTAGSIHGAVTKVSGDEVRLEVAPEVEITLSRGAVAALLEPTQGASEPRSSS